MSQLTAFRDHCRKMADAEHKPECPSLPANIPYWPAWHGIYDDAGDIEALGWNGPPPSAPTCAGCNSDTDRALFARMAAEVDQHLDRDLFAEANDE